MTVAFDPATKNANFTLSGGNLVASINNSSGSVKSDTARAAGKWYAEFKITTLGGSNEADCGISPSTLNTSADGHLVGVSAGADAYGYYKNGQKYTNTVGSAYGATYTLNDVISILFDGDAHTITFWKNGVSQGTAFTGLSALSYNATFSGWTSGGSTTQVTANFGATAFVYTPPVGYTYWDGTAPPAPTVGDGEGTLEALIGVGYRVAAGAGTMEEFTATGGYNGLGAATLEYLVVSGSGGIKYGEGTLSALTGSGTGYQAATGAATLQSLTATGTGYDSEIITTAGTAPAPILSSSGDTGEVITFAGAAPVPVFECHTKDARLTAPVPTVEITLVPGAVATVSIEAKAPSLVSTNDNPAIITVSGLARVPLLVATLASGRIATFAGSARVPVLSSSSLVGNDITVAAEAAAPILSAAGYPAYTITFAGVAPVTNLVSVLSGAVSANYRTWALNTRKGVLTEYDNFSFNSYANFNGYVLAAGSSGIVTLGAQDLDNATAITARVRSGKDSFRSSVHKRVPRAYLGHTADGDLHFRMVTNEGGTRTYLLGWNHATGLQQRRVPIGKGPKSRWFQWEVENVAGADFDINNVMLYPTKLRRRVQ